MGWLGNFFLIWGTSTLDPKKRWPFLLLALGEIAWFFESLIINRWDMIFLCVVFTILAIRNYLKWKNST